MKAAESAWPPRYEPSAVEERVYRLWIEAGCFSAAAGSSRAPYVIVIPPPNITGILTMGHVLNNTLQDILVRWQRMKGKEALWVPGTDHAGIATQNVVEKALRREGSDRHRLGREKFVARVWEWRENYGGTIIRQLKKLGCSCDWSRERFTLDEGLSRAVREVFVRLYRRGLIYRGPYLINWCPRCHTALSDEEVEHRDLEGSLWHIRYPLSGSGGHVTVATTRPETMLGDTAVAVNPADPRYSGLIGRRLRLPLTEREIPVVADHFVDPAFGTGAVKVTPAHDPNDFEMGRRHNLPQVTVMDTSGRMTAEAGRFQGLDRFEARERIVEELGKQGLLEKTVPHVHAVGHCYRCDTVIEPRLSVQWFVKMKPLAVPALQAVLDGRVRFYPERWVKVYEHWMNNIRDWCISRQLWWGHRIPAWYRGEEIFVGDGPPPGEGWVQDEDVLDTWFSSWLWPFSTLGWPEQTEDLGYFYPTSTLVTGPDIIFFWVARMLMAGCEFMGEVPFRAVYFTGIIRDVKGRKMSKSLGNSPDPLDVIAEYGADALRFTVARLSPIGQDVYYSNEMCELGRNFANKIWNASRFVMSAVGGNPVREPAEGEAADVSGRAVLSRLERTAAAAEAALESFRFNEAALEVYDFFWHHFCDRYLETVKSTLTAADDAGAALIRGTLVRILKRVLGLLHPFMPFLTEEIWGRIDPGQILAVSPWPAAEEAYLDPAAEAEIEFRFSVLTAMRNLRAEYGIAPARKVVFYLCPEDPALTERLRTDAPLLEALLRSAEVRVEPGWKAEGTAPSALAEGCRIYMPLKGIVDIASERERFGKLLRKAAADFSGVSRRLEDRDFLDRAPLEVREKTQVRKVELETEIKRLEAIISGLSAPE